MKPHKRRRRRNKAGLAPGTPVFTGEQRLPRVAIHVTSYGPDHYEVQSFDRADEVLKFRDSPQVTWIDVCGLHDVETVEKLGTHFGLHPLVIEDILHTDQRVKVDEYDGYLFIVVKDLQRRDGLLEGEQVSFILTPCCVLSFQEIPGDSFDAVRRRLEAGRGRMRQLGADYLVYALLDATVDNYFVLLEQLGEEIERLEEALDTEPHQNVGLLHTLRRQLVTVRRAVWPLREALGILERHESPLIETGTRIFMRDLYDHTIQAIDSVESARDLLSSLLELQLSSTSNRMNEVMKTLTAITAIFIPLTFLAGIYGMNFKYMPELEWHYSYPLLWALMLVIAMTLLILFRRKKWI